VEGGRKNGVGRAVRVELLQWWSVGLMYVVYVYIVGGGVLRIPDILRTVGFVLMCGLVVCVYHPLPILLYNAEVLFCGYLGLKLLFTAICLTLVDYFIVLYGSVIL
jgi:hypothetical protein